MVSKDSEGYPEQLCATEEISELACPNLYLNREINWLDFDAKVLDEATDAGLPLLEQLKFLSIFYNNLDEFFMVRVANIYRQYRSGAVSSSPDRMTPAKQLAEIRRKVLILVSRAQEHWRKRLAPQLHDKGVKVMTGTDSVIDHWSPYGLGDMLEKANLYAQLYIRPNEQNLSRSLFLATGDILPLNEKGERVWPKAQDDASFVLVDASCSAEAVARISPRTATFHKGQLVWGSVAG